MTEENHCYENAMAVNALFVFEISISWSRKIRFEDSITLSAIAFS